jgi:hypothetical protein
LATFIDRARPLTADELTTVMWIVGDEDGKITVAFTCLVATTVLSGVAVLVSAKAAKL